MRSIPMRPGWTDAMALRATDVFGAGMLHVGMLHIGMLHMGMLHIDIPKISILDIGSARG
jgi:hypothetical protein